jgi:isocitrate/isopropylmalate dehydrogenase
VQYAVVPSYSICLRQILQILKVIEKERPEVKFNFQEHLLGGVSTFQSIHVQSLVLITYKCSINAHGTAITDEALNAAKSADAVLLGAIGGPVSALLHFGHFVLTLPIGMGNGYRTARTGSP